MGIVKAVLFNRTENTLVQFFRYGFVAVIALTVDFGLLIAFKEGLGLNYILAGTISFIFGLITNYVLSVYWVFHSSKLTDKKSEFLFFGVIGLIGLGLTDLILWFCTSKLGIYYVISKSIAVIIVYCWNFGMRKVYLFN